MIERTVLIKLESVFCEPDQRRRIAVHSRDTLSAVPGVLAVEAGVPADPKTEGDWDLCLKVRFASVDDIPGYALHPRHRSYVDDYLRPKLETIRAWNFESV
jgi:hypothetical protein